MESDNYPPYGEQNNQPAQEPSAASSGTMSAPVQTLLAYSEARANVNDVMRSLVSHRNWLVPITFVARDGEPRRVVDNMLILSTETRVPPDELWIFTDPEAAYIAQARGAELGAYAGGIHGTELFHLIDSASKTVRVNPGSAREHSWIFQDGSASEVGNIWADAIALENSFEQWQQTGTQDKTAVMNYRAFLLYNHSSGPVITLPNQGGMQNPAAAFTAPDCADMFLSKLSKEQASQMQQVITSGERLFDTASELGVDGLIINCFGPGTTYAFPFQSVTSE